MVLATGGSLILIARVDSPTGMKLVTSPSQMPALDLGLPGIPLNMRVISGLGLATGLGKFSLNSSPWLLTFEGWMVRRGLTADKRESGKGGVDERDGGSTPS